MYAQLHNRRAADQWGRSTARLMKFCAFGRKAGGYMRGKPDKWLYLPPSGVSLCRHEGTGMGHMLDEMRTERVVAGHQRSRGEARVGLAVVRGATRLRDLRQAGCAKAFLPRVHTPDPEVVFLNTAGGLTGGDRLFQRLDLGSDARATATTQTAERVYASSGGRAEVDVTIRAAAGARVTWCPQETILFDKSALARRTTVELEGDATCLMAETLVLGRTAMGEVIRDLDLSDRREIRRDGKPVFVEPIRMDGDWLARRDGPAVLPGGAMALSTLVLVSGDAADRLDSLRRILPARSPDLVAAASAWDGVLVLRALGSDTLELRRLVGRALTHLSGAPLPRVWQI